MGLVAGNQHPRVCLPIGDVRDDNQTGVSNARDAPKAQFGGFAALAPRVQHQRLLPQTHLVIHHPRAHAEAGLHHVVGQFGGNQFALRHLFFGGVNEADASAIERLERRAAIHAHR